MHAYGHEWACQLVYNPRLREGAGLSDLEGTERFWSRCRRLIVLERYAGVCELREDHFTAANFGTAADTTKVDHRQTNGLHCRGTEGRSW
jgi:hypothetical protein